MPTDGNDDYAETRSKPVPARRTESAVGKMTDDPSNKEAEEAAENTTDKHRAKITHVLPFVIR
jgi:hypothetical protein